MAEPTTPPWGTPPNPELQLPGHSCYSADAVAVHIEDAVAAFNAALVEQINADPVTQTMDVLDGFAAVFADQMRRSYAPYNLARSVSTVNPVPATGLIARLKRYRQVIGTPMWIISGTDLSGRDMIQRFVRSDSTGVIVPTPAITGRFHDIVKTAPGIEHKRGYYDSYTVHAAIGVTAAGGVVCVDSDSLVPNPHAKDSKYFSFMQGNRARPQDIMDTTTCASGSGEQVETFMRLATIATGKYNRGESPYALFTAREQRYQPVALRWNHKTNSYDVA